MSAGDRRSCLRRLRETSSSGCGIPAFIGKSSAAPTPAPHAAAPSLGAARRSAEADHRERGGAAFTDGGKKRNFGSENLHEEVGPIRTCYVEQTRQVSKIWFTLWFIEEKK